MCACRARWGLPRRRILVYVLKNALAPVVTVAAMSFGYMFGWALIIEQVFNIAGMSRALLSAIFRRDYLMIENVVLVITAVFLAANLIADLLYALARSEALAVKALLRRPGSLRRARSRARRRADGAARAVDRAI